MLEKLYRRLVGAHRWPIKVRAVVLISGVVLGIQVVLLALLSLQIRSEASRAVALEVDRTRRLFNLVRRQQEEALLAQGRVIADVPLLGATLDTHDPATVLALLQHYRAKLGWDLYLATDDAGRFLAKTEPPAPVEMGVGMGNAGSPEGATVPGGVRSALKGAEQAGFFEDVSGLYQIATVPVHIGLETQGTLTLGAQVNDRLAGALKAASDSEVSFAVGDHIIASTLPPALRSHLEDWLRSSRGSRPRQPVLLHDAPDDVLTEEIAFPSSDIGKAGSIIVQQSLSRPLAAFHRLRAGLLIAGLLTLLLLIAVSVVLAEGVTEPVLHIARAARSLSSGDWSQRVAVTSNDELRDLADAFNHMADRLQGWDEALRREVDHRTRELNATVAELDRAYQRLRGFNADAAHEILTPLTIMRGELEVTLRSARDPEEYGRVLATVLDEVLRLTRIVEGLLALARADAGEAHLQREAVPLGRLLQDVCGALEAAARTKGVDLRPPECPEVVVEGDEDRLRQLFLNLVGNAVKYTRAGDRIEMACETGGGAVRVRVADTGPGIEARHLPRLFDRFYRVDRARSRSMGGSGLGLAICKWIVEAHAGSIEVSSRPGEGTVFTVVLPLQQSHDASGGGPPDESRAFNPS